MGNIYLFSLIAGLLMAILIIPFYGLKGPKKDKGKSGRIPQIVLAILLVVLVFIFYYLFNIDRNLTSLWFIITISAALGAMFSTRKEQMVKSLFFLGSLVFSIYLLTAFLFNANEKYETAKMDQQIEIKTFDETKTPASVPPQFARNKMRKAFGQVPNTSYYELGSLQIQKVKGEYVYIAPVEFSGVFKWWNGKTTPGYFTLSATDSSANPKFIKSEMAYTPSSYFGKSIERHIRTKYPKYIFHGDVQLEVNEDGKPFYIRSFGNFISARNGFDVKGIVLVDPLSGKSDAYALGEIPDFIDGAVSPEVVSLQNSYFGNYVHGFWNSVFGKKDVKLPSDEGTEANVTPIFDENGSMYYFTDFSSPKEGVDSMLGYSLTDSRTGKATYYTGNLEESYMDSEGALQIIEKKFIEKKWKGKMPVLYNFYGEASWLTPVLDSNGFLQNYFIVSAANPETSVYGTTPNDALRQYKLELQRGGGGLDGRSKAEEKQAVGTVLRVYKEKSGDYTAISFLLDNRKSFIVSSEREPLAIYLKEGDKVQLTYQDTGENFLPAIQIKIDGLN
ncbi:hypothetical protein [Bacillus sp. FJAT-27445]|uniref:hypothetical protein n=1 Tax=Bacillus sp. FJAT-27445 TaxID=1679166 RepID=UPI000743C34E|nr:hypothetical protein [Bacillus sp. FJAT-27445]